MSKIINYLALKCQVQVIMILINKAIIALRMHVLPKK